MSESYPHRFSPLGHFLISLLICTGLSLLIVVGVGVPCNIAAGAALVIPVMLCFLATLSKQLKTRRLLRGAAFLIYLYLLVPFSSHYYSDLRNGRYAVLILPGALFLTKSYQSHAILQKHLGPAPAVWSHACPGPGWFRVRDGNERVNSASIVWSDLLPIALEKLPDDAARKQVLSCVTDRANLLRVHQSFLLTCLALRGFPKNHTSESWWKRHQSLFRSEYDADTAVALTVNWRERSLAFAPEGKVYASAFDSGRYVLECQERGSWGGDQAYNQAYEKLWQSGAYTPELGLDAVDWWDVE